MNSHNSVNKAIRRRGWKTVSVQGFLSLSNEDMAIIEERMAVPKRPRAQTTRAAKDGRKERTPPQVRGEIKVVGKSGQISLGKSYAGKTLRVEHHRGGTIILTAVAVPKTQRWTLEEPHRSRIRRGLAWASTATPVESGVDDFVAQSAKAARRLRGRRR